MRPPDSYTCHGDAGLILMAARCVDVGCTLVQGRHRHQPLILSIRRGRQPDPAADIIYHFHRRRKIQFRLVEKGGRVRGSKYSWGAARNDIFPFKLLCMAGYYIYAVEIFSSIILRYTCRGGEEAAVSTVT